MNRYRRIIPGAGLNRSADGFPLNGIDLIDDLARLFATKISRRESFGQIERAVIPVVIAV